MASTSIGDILIDNQNVDKAELRAYLQAREVATPEDFGARSDLDDNQEALQAWLNSGRPLYIEKTYKSLGGLVCPGNAVIISNGGVIDFRDTASVNDLVLDATFGRCAFVVNDQNTITLAAEVTTALTTRGANFIFVDDLSPFEDDDVIILYDPTDGSFNGARASYRKGEFAQLYQVDSDRLRVAGRLHDSYPIGTEVYRFGGVSLGLRGQLTIHAPYFDADTSVVGVLLNQVRDSDISGLRAFGGTDSAMRLSQCYNVTGRNVAAISLNPSNNLTTQYGLVASNCQHLDIEGIFIGRRHGFTNGSGGVARPVNRFQRIHGYFGSWASSSADLHGNAEYCELSGVATNGVQLAGDKNSWSGDAYSATDGRAVWFREMLGWSFKISGRIYSRANPWTDGFGVVDISRDTDATATTVRGGVLDFSGVEMSARVATKIIQIINKGSAPGTYDDHPKEIHLNFAGMKLPIQDGTPSSGWIETAVDSGSNFTSVDMRGVEAVTDQRNIGGADRILGEFAGTWTPVLQGGTTPGSPTHSVQNGFYYTVGDMVFASFQVTVTDLGAAAGDAQISGLPFNASTSAALSTFMPQRWNNITFAAGYNSLSGIVESGQSVMTLRMSGTANSSSVVQISDLTATVTLVGTIIYRRA